MLNLEANFCENIFDDEDGFRREFETVQNNPLLGVEFASHILNYLAVRKGYDFPYLPFVTPRMQVEYFKMMERVDNGVVNNYVQIIAQCLLGYQNQIRQCPDYSAKLIDCILAMQVAYRMARTDEARQRLISDFCVLTKDVRLQYGARGKFNIDSQILKLSRPKCETLVPVDNSASCWVCKIKCADPKCGYQLKLTGYNNSKSISYLETATVIVPRCKNCMMRDERKRAALESEYGVVGSHLSAVAHSALEIDSRHSNSLEDLSGWRKLEKRESEILAAIRELCYLEFPAIKGYLSQGYEERVSSRYENSCVQW